MYWFPYSSHTSHHPSQTPCLPWISYTTQKLMLASCNMIEMQSEAFHTFLWHFFPNVSTKKSGNLLNAPRMYLKSVHFYRLKMRKYKFFRQIICKTKAYIPLRFVNIFNYNRQHFTKFHSIFRKFMCHFLWQNVWNIYYGYKKKFR